MKTLMITSQFTLNQNGLSDYCVSLFEEMKKNSEVLVLTQKGIKKKENVFPEIENWFSFEILKISEFLDGDTQLLLQYVPTMYSKKGGINLLLPLYLLYLKIFKRTKIKVMFHEVAYPFLPDIKSVILALIHRAFAFLLVMASDEIFVSTGYLKNMLRKYTLGRRDISVLAIPAMIKKYKATDEEIKKIIREYKLTESRNKLVVLGGFHPSKNLPLAYELANENPEVELIHIGVTKEDVLKEGCSLSQNIILPGRLDENTVSIILSLSHYCWGYFIDGATLRRSTLTNALEHGCHFLTTKTFKTDIELLDIPNLHFFPLDPVKFKHKVLKIMGENLAKTKSQSIIEFSEIAKRVLSD